MALLLIACGEKPAHRSAAPAFFYWQTTFRLSPAEVRYLDSVGCQKLYIKMLDLGRDPQSGEVQPLARLEIADSSGLAGREIVPCVFMTNGVFQNIAPEKIVWLAERVLEIVSPPLPPPEGGSRVGEIIDRGLVENTERSATPPLRGGQGGAEIQFDCDWTPSTREAYFAFLREIKKRLPADCRLSATIRLHQYKFPDRTGVPPADRGMLMLYNTGDIDDPGRKNSIFGVAEAEKYLVGAPADYPLPLDVALPAFSWALVYRSDELWKIIPGFDAAACADTSFFWPLSGQTQAPGTATFFVRRGTFRGGFYLRPDDGVRVESVPPDLLAEAARLAASTDLADDATVAFFHLDSTAVRRYPVQTIQTVWQEFLQ